MKGRFVLTYDSSLTRLCEINPSFDRGILRIAYPGYNRNKSYISKETFERCLKTIYNCPVVCNYNRETDTLGGHDVALVKTKDDKQVIVNLTNPVGVIPESAKTFWQEVEEDDGTIHEYLCCEILLWKRQEAYDKIKRDGIVRQSMEIDIVDSDMIDGVCHIHEFVFLAFALIGTEPCFESASVDVESIEGNYETSWTYSFSYDFKNQMADMMSELKSSLNLVNFSNSENDDIEPIKSMEGGEKVLDKKDLLTKYGIDVSTIDFSIDDYTYEELEEKFKSISANNEDTSSDTSTPENNGSFALTSDIICEIERTLESETVQKEWGETPRYHLIDCDIESKEIYCLDSNDWLLYGFPYKMDGDYISIDFACKKRKKYAIVDFDEGEQASSMASVFANLEKELCDNAEWKSKYEEASNTIESMNSELKSLRDFKANTEAVADKTAKEKVFSMFSDLIGVDAFESLKDKASDYDVEALEEKCYAIRGRQNTALKFELDNALPKIKVDKNKYLNDQDEPYGGLFVKHGFTTPNK